MNANIPQRFLHVLAGAVIGGLAVLSLPAWATTKGLNQIVTPDIQPTGVFSLSYQAQNDAIGNSNQLQFELGLTKRLEIAETQGLSPEESAVDVEYALIQSPSFLLSTGVLGMEHGMKSQPFLEGGYYRGKGFVIGGIQQLAARRVPVLGAGYQVTPPLLVTADYLGGSGNFSTAGITYNFTPTFSINPAIYYSNGRPHRIYGYGVVTWNIKAW